MNLKRIVSAIAVAALVGASTLGLGAGVAAADAAHPKAGSSQIQSVDWHGHGDWHGRGDWHGWGGGPWWHPRPWGWHW